MTAGRTINAQNHHWGTPLHYIEAVKKVFNVSKIDLDPCSNRYSLVNARIEYNLPLKDGLVESWNYPTIFVNPPYGSDKTRKTTIKHWLKKCHEAHVHHQAEIIALVPVATNTVHWKKYIWVSATAITFLHDTRLKFLIEGKGGGKGAPMSCAMVYWGENKTRFLEVFAQHGAVIETQTNKIYSPLCVSTAKHSILENYQSELRV
jgi:DNA N-6-adenine-methyltransferase (Dam)